MCRLCRGVGKLGMARLEEVNLGVEAIGTVTDAVRYSYVQCSLSGEGEDK
jgi:hypothetical protein